MCNLVEKYNIPGPRYTSYPTVPYWNKAGFHLNLWKASVNISFKESNLKEGISLYIHLPFCESMCTFCGCNKRITKNHEVEMPYIKAVLKEFALYSNFFDGLPIIKQLHLGGGTPTFFDPEHLKKLIEGIFTIGRPHQDCEMSFEGHPNNTSDLHLKILYQLGFRRVCYGVQDYNLTVQKAINRIQPFKAVERVTQQARDIGYTSVGHDIIYGLPFQTETDVIHTVSQTISLKPDRIAFYSYAHVPWIKGNGQRGFKTSDLPTASQKLEQYTTGKQMLLDAGYIDIGMDHFALPSDALCISQQTGTLHRNFMGYTPSKTQMMIGLGVSAISDTWYGFAQNTKHIEGYIDLVNQNVLPVFRGHMLTAEDLIIRQHILNIMCDFETEWRTESLFIESIPEIIQELLPLEEDGLVVIFSDHLKVTPKGRNFLRNICMPFDLRMKQSVSETVQFSKTI